MAGDNYEMIPHKLLEDLRYDVEALKKQLQQPERKVNELILEIESLKDSIHDLHTVFSKALEDIKDENDITKVLPDMKKQLAQVVSQNETIAKGMLAIADKVDAFVNSAAGAKSAPVVRQAPPSMPGPKPMGMPSQGMPPRMSPPPNMGPSRIAPPPMSSAPSNDLPPPPPSMGKKGFF